MQCYLNLIYIQGAMNSERKREFDITTQKEEFEPQDTVSKIVWDPYVNEPRFLTAGWDGYARLYIIKQGTRNYSSMKSQVIQKVWELYFHHPVLCCQINKDQTVIVGLASGQIVATNLRNSSATALIGTHDAPICQIFWIDLGFDFSLKVWSFDTNNNNYLQKQYILPKKTFTAAYHYPILLIGSNDSEGIMFEVSRETITNLNIPSRYDMFQMDLLSNFTSSAINLSTSTAILGTIDGRLLVVDFDFTPGHYGRPSQIRVKREPVKSRSQKKQISAGMSKKIFLGNISGVDIGIGKRTPFYIGYGTFNLQVYDIISKAIHITVKGNYDSPIVAAKLCPKQIYLVFATGNDWLKGLGSLKQQIRPKLRAIRFKESQLSSFG